MDRKIVRGSLLQLFLHPAFSTPHYLCAPLHASSPFPFQESIKDLSVPHDELGIARVQVARKRTNLHQLHLFAVNDHFPNIVQFQHQASPKVRDVVAKWQDEECNESDNQQSNKGRTASRQQD
jgi:hypothetical protein